MTVLKEPFIQFLLIGAAVFGLYSFFVIPDNKSDNIVVIDAKTVNSIKKELKNQYGSLISEDELKKKAAKAIDKIVEQKILYKEGLFLNLDKNDPVIERRVAWKTRMVAIERANLHPVSDLDIKNYYNSHKEDFTVLKKISTFQLAFSVKKRGADALNDCLLLFDDIKNEKIKEEILQGSGDSVTTPLKLREGTLLNIERIMGKSFADAVDKRKKTGWIGCVKSNDAVYLVKVTKIIPPRLIPLNDVKQRIKRVIQVKRDDKIFMSYMKKLKKRYSVIFETKNQ
jgi:hypothetical protein